MYEQTKAKQSSSIGVKSEVKAPPTPTGLSYAGGGRGDVRANTKKHTHADKTAEGDTDSIMTEKRTTQ